MNHGGSYTLKDGVLEKDGPPKAEAKPKEPAKAGSPASGSQKHTKRSAASPMSKENDDVLS